MIYKVSFSMALYKNHRDGTFTYLGQQECGYRLFTELSLPGDLDCFHLHPKPLRPKNVDEVRHCDEIEELNPRTMRWEFVCSTSY